MIFKNKKKVFLKHGDRFLIIICIIILGTVAVKAVDFQIGKTRSQNNLSQCPDDMAYVVSAGGGFCLDKYEASAGPDCPYANPQNQSDTRVNLSDNRCKTQSQLGSLPWRFISQDQAAMACAKAGKRLPNNKEWLQAGLGTPDVEVNWTEDDCQVNNNWGAQPGLTGSGKNCVSPAGVYDMIGNVWEWTENTIYDGAYNGKPLPDEGYITGVDEDAMPSSAEPDIADKNYYNDYFWQKKSGTRGIARGGYWNNKSDGGQYAVYAVNPPSFSGEGVGFRCAK